LVSHTVTPLGVVSFRYKICGFPCGRVEEHIVFDAVPIESAIGDWLPSAGHHGSRTLLRRHGMR